MPVSYSGAREELSFPPKDIYCAYPHLNSVRLNQWRRIDPDRFGSAKSEGRRFYSSGKSGKSRKRRPIACLFSETQLPDLAVLARCYEKGLGAEQTRKVLENPASLRARVPGVAELTMRIADRPGLADEREVALRCLRECITMLGCASAFLFERREDDATNHVGWHLVAALNRSSPSPETDVDTMYQRGFLSRELAGETRSDRAINLYGALLDVSATRDMPTSALVLPVCLKKNAPRFCFWVQNKLDRDGLPNRACIFDPVDEATLEWIGALLARLWQTTVIRGLFRMAQAADSAQEFTSIMRVALETALSGTGAYRGEITEWSETERGLRIIVAAGPTGVPEGSLLRDQSICRWVYQNRLSRYAPDVSKDSFYQMCNERTKSQLSLPIVSTHANEIFGVLSLESDQLDAFSEQDRIVAQLCASNISQIAHFVAARDTIVSQLLVQQGPSLGAVPHPTALQSLLREVCDEFRFRKGLAYLPSHTSATLDIHAMRLDSNKLPLRPFGIATPSLATKVFREGTGYFSADPKRDLNANADGLLHYNVEGPVIAVPLRFGRLTVGVMTLWDHQPPAGAEPADPRLLRKLWESEMTEIESFAQEYFGGGRLQLQDLVMETMMVLREGLFQARSANAVMDAVLKAVTAVFDRGRVCRTIPGSQNDSFLVTGSRCSGKDLDSEPDDLYRNEVIENCAHVVFGPPDHPIYHARRFDPRGAEMFADPNAVKLGKPLDLPYANGPLWAWVNGSLGLLGYIGADNKISRKRITRLHLDALDRITAIAALFFARFGFR